MAKQSRKVKAQGKEVPSRVVRANRREDSWLGSDWFAGWLLVLLVILVYQPVWYAGYIWDDNVHVTENPTIIGPLGLKEIWTTSAGQFFPLSLTTFWLEHALCGLKPLPYHLVNVFQQAACAVLLWRVLLRLRIPGAWVGAALWALHPLQVETVAWITELKNTQSGLFYLLTILFFLRWLPLDNEEKSGHWNYVLTLLFTFLALASKSTTCVLPAVLILCACWIEGRWNWRNLPPLTPIILMSIGSSALALLPQFPDATSIPDTQWTRSWPEKIAASGDVIWFYLGKLICPYPLMPIYPRWRIDGTEWISYLPLLAAIVGMSVLWFKRKSPWFRPAFFAFTYFLLVLSPFLGFINQSFWYYSLVEDHLQYLAAIGPLALVGAGIVTLAKQSWLQSCLASGLLLLLSLLSWQRAWVYQSEENLWSDELAKNYDCWAAYNNLGNVLLKRGQLDEAKALFQKALEFNSGFALAYTNLGDALFQKGQRDEAMILFRKALDIYPGYALAHYDLGDALLQTERKGEAAIEFQKALEINPYLAEAHGNLGGILLQKGQLDEAIVQFQKALEIKTDYAEAHYNLGNALLKKGDATEAIVQFETFLRLQPGNSNGEAMLAKAQAVASQKTGPAK